MIEADLPSDEDIRLNKLYELDILDTIEEQAYDDLTKLAAEICQTPIALVSLVDKERQWFKSHHGLDARETPRDIAFCSHAILDDKVFIIEDSSKDERFFDNPLATGAPHVTFYAGAPLIMSDQRKLGTLCVISDTPKQLTTSQKEALSALARQVVTQLELRLKIKELKQLDHAKDEFISMASHELRTPLTSIYGSLSLLLNNSKTPLNAKQSSLITIAYRNSERLLSLVNDILELSKIESGLLKFENSSLNPAQLVNKALELNQAYCTECNTKIKFICTDECKELTVFADEQRLLQVLSNFISNAAKFTFDGDTVELRLKKEGNYAVIEVVDHGPGITIEQQKLVFMKFKQLDAPVNNKLPGTGLGLNISKNIIELQNGIIGFESIPKTKTTFYFKLPLVK
ncbi:MAG: GAF domain-containing sensor histidine kinase [Cycloclasticus sp.]|nr:GAF domain-containing sensor histidine kinase [Cycloclasticus sp.]MBQ0789161.1 GAF domain-containing sensor histidine kinase [Cycloclasticus sp.]